MLPNNPRGVPRVDDRQVFFGTGSFGIANGYALLGAAEGVRARTTCYNRFVCWRKAGVWDRLMDVNHKSMFLCCEHVIPRMLQRRKGSIVNLASISSFVGQEMNGVSTFAYNITKAGALQLTKSLASRYAADGIRVNCVCPGNVETDIIKRTTLRRQGRSSCVIKSTWFAASIATMSMSV